MKQYIVGTIETSYSKERYLCIYNSEKHYSEENAVNSFLTYNCFCDDYDITEVRKATQEEIEKLNSLLIENINNDDYGFWEAQTEVIYPNHNSINEIIEKYASN